MAKRHKNPSDRPSNEGSASSGARPPAPHLGGPLGSSGAAPGSPDPVSPSGEELPEPTAPEVSERAAASKSTPAASKDADAESKAGLSKDEDPATDAPSDAAAAGDAKADVTAKGEPAADKDGDAEAADGDADKESKDKKPDDKASGGKADDGEKPADKPAEGDAAEGKEGDADKDKEGDGGKKDGVDVDLDKPVVVTTGTSSGKRVTRVLRRANPIKAARSATRTTSAWARKPSGRLLIPAVAAALLIGAAGAAGAYLVPKALESGVAPSRSPGFPLDQAAADPVAPTGGAVLPPVDPSAGAFNNPLVPPVGATRPADALQGWAQGVGTRVGIPVVAVQAYGYAELVAARTAPNCHLSWTTVAAIAKVESSHGSANGAVLNADGSVQPPIYGLPLDGKGGRQLIADTDKGVLDGDSTFDRAVGPLQFVPATWQEMQVDADNSGASDPNDIDDASLAAALYLCKGGRDLSKADAWWDAILTYNAVRPYAQKVFDAANEYGQRSRV